MRSLVSFRCPACVLCLSLLGVAASSCEFGDVQHKVTFTGVNLVHALSVAGEPGTAYIVGSQSPSEPPHVRGYDTATGALIGTTPSWSGGWTFVSVEKVEDNFGGGPPTVISLHQNGHIVTWPATLGFWTSWDSGYLFEKTRTGDFVGEPGVDADYVCDFESQDGKHWLLAGVTVDQATGLRYPYVEHVGYYIDDVVGVDLHLIESPYPATSTGPTQNHCPKVTVDPTLDEFRVLWRESGSPTAPEYRTRAHRYRWDLVWDGYDIVEVGSSPYYVSNSLWSGRDQVATYDTHYVVAQRNVTQLFHETSGIEDSLVASPDFTFVDMSAWWTGSDATRRLWAVNADGLHAISFVP